jgi:ATP/maltotriose-dependent transcriptional regulator MalT
VFDEALDEARRAGSPPRLISTLSFAIQGACETRDVDRAGQLLAEAQRALGAYVRILEGLVEASAAQVAFARGDRPGAVAAARDAVATLDAATPGKSSLMPTQTFLAQALNANGQFSEALSVAERSLALATSRFAHQPHAAATGLALLQVAIARDRTRRCQVRSRRRGEGTRTFAPDCRAEGAGDGVGRSAAEAAGRSRRW